MEQEFLDFYIDNYLSISTHEEVKMLLHFINMVDDTGYAETTLSDLCRDIRMSICEIERGLFSLQSKGLAKLTAVNVDDNIVLIGLNYELRQLQEYHDLPAVSDDEVEDSEEYINSDVDTPKQTADELKQDLDLLFKFVNGFYEKKQFKMDLAQAKLEYIYSLDALKYLAEQLQNVYEDPKEEEFVIDSLRKLKDFAEKHGQILRNLLGG